MARKPGIGGLLILGLAALGAYKYSQMTEEQKTSLKNKGKKFIDDNFGGLKSAFSTNGQQREEYSGT